MLDQARKCVYAKNNQFGRYGNKVYWQAPAFLSCGDELEGVIERAEDAPSRRAPTKAGRAS